MYLNGYYYFGKTTETTTFLTQKCGRCLSDCVNVLPVWPMTWKQSMWGKLELETAFFRQTAVSGFNHLERGTGERGMVSDQIHHCIQSETKLTIAIDAILKISSRDATMKHQACWHNSCIHKAVTSLFKPVRRQGFP